jgi:hypothetical protein
MAKKDENNKAAAVNETPKAEAVVQATTDETIVVEASADPKEEVTDADVTSTEQGVIGDKVIDVKVIDETPKAVLTLDPSAPKAFFKLRDTGGCWGMASVFIAGHEVKEFNLSPFVSEGERTGALIRCDKDGNPLT